MPEKISIMNPREKQVYTWFLVVVLVLFCLATYISRFNPLEVLWEQGEFWKFLFQDFLPATLQCFAGSSRIDSCNFCVGGFVQLRCGSVCFSFRCVRQHFFITMEGTGQNDPGVCHFSEEYPDTGLGFYSFFVTGYWYRGWFYCFADFDLCLYDKSVY